MMKRKETNEEKGRKMPRKINYDVKSVNLKEKHEIMIKLFETGLILSLNVYDFK